MLSVGSLDWSREEQTNALRAYNFKTAFILTLELKGYFVLFKLSSEASHALYILYGVLAPAISILTK